MFIAWPNGVENERDKHLFMCAYGINIEKRWRKETREIYALLSPSYLQQICFHITTNKINNSLYAFRLRVRPCLSLVIWLAPPEDAGENVCAAFQSFPINFRLHCLYLHRRCPRVYADRLSFSKEPSVNSKTLLPALLVD